MKTTEFKWIYTIVIAIFGFMVITGCSEEDDPVPATDDPNPNPEVPAPEEPGDEEGNLFYQLIRIENLEATTNDPDADPTAPRNPLYFSLEDSTWREDIYKKSNKWDLVFFSLYNSFLAGNNGDDENNLGYGANGIGGICILAENFDDVTAIPSPEKFMTAGGIGTDAAGFFGAGLGWYLYDFGGTIMGDGSYEKQHVAYALQETRTIVLRTAKGNFAKIRMISCYKDAFTPEEWFRNTPHMYFTFEYVMVPAGSTEFEIRS